MLLPQAKNKNIVVQNLNDEVLIYDLSADRALCLNDTSAQVFNACDGVTTFDELKEKHRLTDEIIYLALDELKKENLLEGEYASPFAGMNRREVIKKVGLASMIALPLVVGLAAPSSAQAASTCTAGTSSTDPAGSQGSGNTCGCGTNVGAGTPCGRGTTGVVGSTCKAGCTCVATNCSPVTSTCVGLCG